MISAWIGNHPNKVWTIPVQHSMISPSYVKLRNKPNSPRVLVTKDYNISACSLASQAHG